MLTIRVGSILPSLPNVRPPRLPCPPVILSGPRGALPRPISEGDLIFNMQVISAAMPPIARQLRTRPPR